MHGEMVFVDERRLVTAPDHAIAGVVPHAREQVGTVAVDVPGQSEDMSRERNGGNALAPWILDAEG